MTIAQARTGLAAAVTTGTGIRCDPYETDQVLAPCFQVGRNAYDPRMVHGGTKAEHHLKLRHYVPRSADKQAQVQMDAAAETSGSTSVKAAVESAANWNGEVDYAAVTNVGEPVVVSRGEAEFLMTEYDVEVVF